jgi:hypothetical protein
MLFDSLLRCLQPVLGRRARRDERRPVRRNRCVLSLESLEDRLVPSSTSTAWVEGFAANAGAGGSGAVAVDNAGNIYTAGGFAGGSAGVNFDPAGSAAGLLTSQGGMDAFVAKYSPTGTFQWAADLGTANDEVVEAMALSTDLSGHVSVYVTGFYNRTAATMQNDQVPGFVAKLNGDTGGVSWLTSVAAQDGRGIAVDGLGNPYATFANSLTPANSDSSGYPSLASLTTGNIKKFDPTNGNVTWNYPIATSAHKNGGVADTFGIAVAGSNVYVTGKFLGKDVNFNPAGNYTLSTTSWNSAYDLKLTTSGAFVWVHPFYAGSTIGTGITGSYAIAVDGPDTVAGKGNVYTYGTFSGTVAFDSAHTLNAGGSAAFVTKLDKSGNLLWAEQLGGNGNLASSYYSGGLTVDASGSVYMTGFFTGSLTLTAGTGSTNLTSQGSWDVFVVKLDLSGNLQWAIDAGGPGNDHGNGVAVDSFGNVYVAGTINRDTLSDPYTATFGDPNHPLTVDTKTSFLWKLTQA